MNNGNLSSSTKTIESFQDLLLSGNKEKLIEICKSFHPVEIAEQLATIPSKDVWQVLRYIEPERRAETFSHIDEERQVEIIENLGRNEIVNLLADMSPDDRADLFRRLPESLQQAILPAMAQAEREDIRRLVAYQEGTAGSVMTSDYATLSPNLTVTEALERLREVAPDKETIYYAYVVDADRKLLGMVSLRELITSRRSDLVQDIMQKDVVVAYVDEDQETVARRIQKYDLLAIPVLNRENALVGIITHDDAIDIITQEQTEDIEKLMAIVGEHEPWMYMKTSVWKHFRNRVFWIIGLGILGLLSGSVISQFENVLEKLTILAFFMPMVADTGGNTGSQTSTLIIRALALREISLSFKDIIKVIWKEFSISIMLGITVAMVVWINANILLMNKEIGMGISLLQITNAVALALGIQVISSALIGAILPLSIAKLKFDPAVVASPALTTIVDVTGLLIYFSIAKFILKL